MIRTQGMGHISFLCECSGDDKDDDNKNFAEYIKCSLMEIIYVQTYNNIIKDTTIHKIKHISQIWLSPSSSPQLKFIVFEIINKVPLVRGGVCTMSYYDKKDKIFHNLRKFFNTKKVDFLSWNQFSMYYNRIMIHDTRETIDHFIVKCMVAKIVYDNSQAVSGEFPIKRINQVFPVRHFDVIDLDNIIVYEIESQKNVVKKDYGFNTKSICLDEMPQSARQGLKDYEMA